MEISYMLTIMAMISLVLAIAAYHKQLAIIIVRGLYGKYSVQFSKYYKSITGNNPFPFPVKDELIQHFLMINEKLKTYPVSGEIKFREFAFGTSLKTIRKNKGHFDYFKADKIGPCEIKNAGYDESLFGKQVREIYFLKDDKLTLGEYVFGATESEEKIKILDALKKRYSVTLSIESLNKGVFLEDKNNSKIFLRDDGFNFVMRYYTNAAGEIQSLIDHCGNKPKLRAQNLDTADALMQEQIYLSRL